jgi:hypothetical protein
VALADVRRQHTKRVDVTLSTDELQDGELERLGALLKRHAGECPMRLLVEVPGLGTAVVRPEAGWSVNPEEALFDELERLLGADRVQLA